MSNSLAIAAVSETLRSLLDRRINVDPNVDPSSDPLLVGTQVTTRPPDRARTNITGNQVNLFLYQTVLNAAWRNQDMPRHVKPGETGQPPLALNLYYLITAYGSDDDGNGILSHRLLGRVMSILHDHPVLGAAEIKAALSNNDLYEQIERVRITPQPLSVEEISKLWMVFQTQYRISTAYQVSVVLIESTLPTKTPLPVLTRGKDDSGIPSQPDLTPPYPTIIEVSPPNQQPSVLLDDVLTVSGHHLDGTNASVEIKHPRLPDAIPLALEPGATATEIKVRVPNQPNDFPAGFYTLEVVIIRPGETFSRRTNKLSFALAPRITTPLPVSVARNTNGDAMVNLTCSPKVLPEQRTALLLGDREILAQPHPAQTDTLTLIITAAIPGEYFVRLRVDGVDSLLVKYKETPPKFDDNQKVIIT